MAGTTASERWPGGRPRHRPHDENQGRFRGVRVGGRSKETRSLPGQSRFMGVRTAELAGRKGLRLTGEVTVVQEGELCTRMSAPGFIHGLGASGGGRHADLQPEGGLCVARRPLSTLRSGTGHRQAVPQGAGCHLPPPAMERHSFPAQRGCLALSLVLMKCIPRGQKERGGHIIRFGVNPPRCVRDPLPPLFVGLEPISYMLLRGRASGSKGRE